MNGKMPKWARTRGKGLLSLAWREQVAVFEGCLFGLDFSWHVVGVWSHVLLGMAVFSIANMRPSVFIWVADTRCPV